MVPVVVQRAPRQVAVDKCHIILKNLLSQSHLWIRITIHQPGNTFAIQPINFLLLHRLAILVLRLLLQTEIVACFLILLRHSMEVIHIFRFVLMGKCQIDNQFPNTINPGLPYSELVMVKGISMHLDPHKIKAMQYACYRFYIKK